MITPKYEIGQRVFWATYIAEERTHPCPDCLDTRKWSATSPAGNDYTFSCPRCSKVYQSSQGLNLRYETMVPRTESRIIGSYRVDSNDVENPVHYMCRETGVGSGSVYREKDLFETEEEAVAAADALAAMRNLERMNDPEIKKVFDQRIDLCNFELKKAEHEYEEAESKVALRALEYKVIDLLDEIEVRISGHLAQTDVEAIQKLLSEFQT